MFFATNKDVILKKSFPLLQSMADALKASPQIRKVLIEGHSDDRGKREYNIELSGRRAQSVKRWLVENGVAELRLDSKGFGPDNPIADNKTAKGRAANRRVDFVIVDPPQPQSATKAAPAEAPEVIDKDPDKKQRRSRHHKSAAAAETGGAAEGGSDPTKKRHHSKKARPAKTE